MKVVVAALLYMWGWNAIKNHLRTGFFKTRLPRLEWESQTYVKQNGNELRLLMAKLAIHLLAAENTEHKMELEILMKKQFIAGKMFVNLKIFCKRYIKCQIEVKNVRMLRNTYKSKTQPSIMLEIRRHRTTSMATGVPIIESRKLASRFV